MKYPSRTVRRFPDTNANLTLAEWVKVRVLETMMRIVSRITNRAFVGLPLCRDPDYRQLNIQFTIDVFAAAIIVNRFPTFMRP